MTNSSPAKQGVGAREAGRQLGVSHSYLLRLASQNRLPRFTDGTFDVEACRRVLAAVTDPAQVRTPDPDRWSLGRRIGARPVTSDQLPATSQAEDLSSIPADPQPDPADYRSRADLPDDFARGVLFGAHAVAYQVPHSIAETVLALGSSYAVQRRAYLVEKDAAFFLVRVPLTAIGVEDGEAEGPTALSPTLFLGLGPLGGAG